VVIGAAVEAVGRWEAETVTAEDEVALQDEAKEAEAEAGAEAAEEALAVTKEAASASGLAPAALALVEKVMQVPALPAAERPSIPARPSALGALQRRGQQLRREKELRGQLSCAQYTVHHSNNTEPNE